MHMPLDASDHPPTTFGEVEGPPRQTKRILCFIKADRLHRSKHRNEVPGARAGERFGEAKPVNHRHGKYLDRERKEDTLVERTPPSAVARCRPPGDKNTARPRGRGRARDRASRHRGQGVDKGPATAVRYTSLGDKKVGAFVCL